MVISRAIIFGVLDLLKKSKIFTTESACGLKLYIYHAVIFRILTFGRALIFCYVVMNNHLSNFRFEQTTILYAIKCYDHDQNKYISISVHIVVAKCNKHFVYHRPPFICLHIPDLHD